MQNYPFSLPIMKWHDSDSKEVIQPNNIESKKHFTTALALRAHYKPTNNFMFLYDQIR